MAVNNNEKIALKILTVVAAAIMIFMALSFMLTPNEGADSQYVLKLKAGENKIKTVPSVSGEFVTFNMALYNNGTGDASTHRIGLTISDDTYSPNSDATHWEFSFVDADIPGSTSYYDIAPGGNKTVTLKVTFKGTTGGEKVTFTIRGKESAIDDPTPDNNDTHLSPFGGLDSEFEYLTVTSSTAYNPDWIPTKTADRIEHTMPDENSYNITIRNLGSKDDNIAITDWYVVQDINENGVIDGADVVNTNWNVNFTTLSGAEYVLDQNISLNSGDSEQITVHVFPALDNTKVPMGHYLIKIIIYSNGGDTTFSDALKAYMPDLHKPHAEVSVGQATEATSTIGSGEKLMYFLDIKNMGNVDDNFYFNVTFSAPGGRADWIQVGDWKYSIEGVDVTINYGIPPQLQGKTDQAVFYVALAEGDTKKIKLTVDPPADINPARYDIQVNLISMGDPNTPPATGVTHVYAIMELPDFYVLSMDAPATAKEGKNIQLSATLGIEGTYVGGVPYAFYVENAQGGFEKIAGTEGTVTFTGNETTKPVTAEWKAKAISGRNVRTVKVKIDPDNTIRETNENNNEASKDIKITTEEKAFPWWIVIVVVIGGVLAVGGYWFFLLAKKGGELTVEEVIVDPEEPEMGETAEITAFIKNEGKDLDSEHNVVVSFYEDYEPIGEQTIDLSEGEFESGDTREVTMEWEPSSPGPHTINVAVDVDNEESDVGSKDVEVKE